MGKQCPACRVSAESERERERERKKERDLLGTTVHNGGSRAAPAARTPHLEKKKLGVQATAIEKP